MDTILVDKKMYLVMCLEILKNDTQPDVQVYVESEIVRLTMEGDT